MLIDYEFSDSDPNGGISGVKVDIAEYAGAITDQELRNLGDYLAANLSLGPAGPSTITLTSITRRGLFEFITLNP